MLSVMDDVYCMAEILALDIILRMCRTVILVMNKNSRSKLNNAQADNKPNYSNHCCAYPLRVLKILDGGVHVL